MHRCPDSRGQALVETALLLPLVIFMLAGLLQWIFLIYVQMDLQHTASRIAALRSTRANGATLLAERIRRGPLGPSWGFLDPASSAVREVPIQPWRHYPGIGTLRSPGRLSTVDLTYRFYPRLMLRWIQKTGAYAERPQEIHLSGGEG